MALSQRLTMRVMGMSEAEIEDALLEAEADEGLVE